MSEQDIEVSNPFAVSDSQESHEVIEQRLNELQAEIKKLPEHSDLVRHAELKLDMAEAQAGLGRAEAAWSNARESLTVFLDREKWQLAVEACDVLFQTGQPASLKALGHGIWLAVTYPIEPRVSINMLNYIIEETDDRADGAAVAAATAHYIVGMRTEGEEFDSLSFLTSNILARVAERHSQVKSQDELDAWIARMGLDNPESFLPKLSLVVGALVEEDWWFDRDKLRARIDD
ncbi:MAG: hypothetical protein ACWA5R_06215 [bacterium]